jgi:hypothetical protein
MDPDHIVDRTAVWIALLVRLPMRLPQANIIQRLDGPPAEAVIQIFLALAGAIA